MWLVIFAMYTTAFAVALHMLLVSKEASYGSQSAFFFARLLYDLYQLTSVGEGLVDIDHSPTVAISLPCRCHAVAIPSPYRHPTVTIPLRYRYR